MDGREGVLLQDGGRRLLHFERRLAHPPEAVWAAITAPDHMSQWFDETHFPEPLTVGGRIRFYHAIIDTESFGEITTLDPPGLIEWRWTSPLGPDSLISWRIEPVPGGCRLILRQEATDPTTIARTLAGWHKCLDKLAAVLEGGEDKTGEGWPELFDRYKTQLLEAGVTTPQAGVPPKPDPKA